MLHDPAPVKALCGSEARYRLVRALYSTPSAAFHLRGLAAAARVDPGQVAKLLPRLLDAGLCEALSDTPFRKYRAARGHPLTDALAQVFADEAGAADVVKLSDAPVLRSLLWSGRERSEIPAREAFRHYEDHWRHVQGAAMGAKEKRLVERLARRYGRGLING